MSNDLYMHHLETGNYLFPNATQGKQGTYTRVKEESRYKSNQILIGFFSVFGPGVDTSSNKAYERTGVARARKS